jgi:hypothetical protein
MKFRLKTNLYLIANGEEQEKQLFTINGFESLIKCDHKMGDIYDYNPETKSLKNFENHEITTDGPLDPSLWEEYVEPETRQAGTYGLFTPTGKAIIGSLSNVVLINQIDYATIDEENFLKPHFTGENLMDPSAQKPLTEFNELLFIDEDSNIWPDSRLVLRPYDSEAPELEELEEIIESD